MKALGKHPKKTDRRTLKMARYLHKLLTPPPAVDHYTKLPKDIGMMGNDKLGDCTVAAAAHMVQSWTAYASALHTISDADVIAAYKVISPNDEGAFMLDVLNHWRKTGVGGDHCEAFVETGVADLVQAKLAIQHFGSLYIGMALPDTNTFGPWTAASPTWKANPYNGHAVCLIGYDDARKMFKVCTWGEIWDMSYGWFQKYVDESYAVLNDIQLIKDTGRSPEGFDWATLQNDLQHLGDPIVDPVPMPVPTPTPTPTPPPVPVVTGKFGPFPARVAQVHDGDTIGLDIDLGFDHMISALDWAGKSRLSCRVYGINAPELKTAAGKQAKAFAQTILPIGTKCCVTSHGWDKYGGRFDGTITLADGSDFATIMMQSGHATPMKMIPR